MKERKEFSEKYFKDEQPLRPFINAMRLCKGMCTKNEKEKGKNETRFLHWRKGGRMERRGKLWGIKLAFLCAEAGWMRNILLPSLSPTFHCKPYFFIPPPTPTTHKQKFAFVMWINKGRGKPSTKKNLRRCFIAISLVVSFQPSPFLSLLRTCMYCQVRSIHGLPSVLM